MDITPVVPNQNKGQAQMKATTRVAIYSGSQPSPSTIESDSLLAPPQAPQSRSQTLIIHFVQTRPRIKLAISLPPYPPQYDEGENEPTSGIDKIEAKLGLVLSEDKDTSGS